MSALVSSTGEQAADQQPIQLCIDGRMLGADGTGVSRYARTLVDAAERAGLAPMILDGGGREGGGRLGRWARAARTGQRHAVRTDDGRRIVAPDIFREAHVHFGLHGRLLELVIDGPPGVMHFTYPVPLRLAGWRNVYTVHDAIPLTQPRLTPIHAGRHRRMLARISKSAAAIVTVSSAARDEIVAALGCPPSLVTDLSEAVGVSAAATGALPAGLTERGYMLFCGSIEPRKNLMRLIGAYRRSGIAMPLVIAGPIGWRGERIRRRAAGAAGVVLLPFQPREQLLGLVASARALLFPSLAEGFGLPVAEAMALGTPVLTSATGALAETAGGGALLVDPLDVPAMADAIALLARDDALCARLAAAGLDRATAFGVQAYAARLKAFYSALAHDPEHADG